MGGRELRRRPAFFGRTHPDTRLRILEDGVPVWRRQVGLRRRARPYPRAARRPLELQRHGLESVEREVRWLSELIDSEHTSNNSNRPPNLPLKETL